MTQKRHVFFSPYIFVNAVRIFCTRCHWWSAGGSRLFRIRTSDCLMEARSSMRTTVNMADMTTEQMMPITLEFAASVCCNAASRFASTHTTQPTSVQRKQNSF